MEIYFKYDVVNLVKYEGSLIYPSFLENTSS